MNFHGGAVVANYPYDDSHQSSGRISRTPDHDFFFNMAKRYADNHGSMSRSTRFRGGVTNGAEWYVVTGGMQDFNYLFSNCFEITIEQTECKYPSSNRRSQEWNLNKNSLIDFLKSAHKGVKGKITDGNGNPIPNAEIVVNGIDYNVKTTENGEFWRLLMPGTYDIKAVDSKGKETEQKSVTVGNGNGVNARRLDFQFETEKIVGDCPGPTGKGAYIHDGVLLDDDQTVEITSPNYGSAYPNGPYNCVWRFRVTVLM